MSGDKCLRTSFCLHKVLVGYIKCYAYEAISSHCVPMIPHPDQHGDKTEYHEVISTLHEGRFKVSFPSALEMSSVWRQSSLLYTSRRPFRHDKQSMCSFIHSFILLLVFSYSFTHSFNHQFIPWLCPAHLRTKHGNTEKWISDTRKRNLVLNL